MYRVYKKSDLSGAYHHIDMLVDETKVRRWLFLRSHCRQDAEPVQDHFPELNSDEREFLMTGITPTEWDQTFRN